MRAVMLFGSAAFSRPNFESGNNGVRSSNRGRFFTLSAATLLMVSTSSIAGFFSLRPAGFDIPETWSPLRKPY